MPLLNSGEVDFGYVNGAEAAFAYTGTGNFDRAHPDVRLVGVMFPLTTGVMAPCDLGLQTVDDMAGRSDLRIASEYTSSTIIPFYIEGVLATGGMSYDDFTQVPVSSFVDGINALGDGLVDVALVSLNAGAGQQAAVQLQDRGGLCYISMNDGEEAFAAYTAVLPSGTIRAMPQNESINGLQSWGANLVAVPWMLLANAGVDEQVVHDLTRVIHQNQEALTASFGAFGNADFSAMAPANAMPYHPGAIRYYEEAGIPAGE
jgi:TRAP transporter TAXI family solute receptor